jgi:superfamily I DNA/RNA helicase
VDTPTLLTLHAAKGLEFEHVFITAWMNAAAHTAVPATTGTLEEERRLF